MGRRLRVLFVIMLVLLFRLNVSAQQIRVGYVHVFDDAPVLIAQDGGFFKDQDLNVNLQAFTSGPSLAKGLVSNQLEIGVMGFTNALSWSAQGADLYIVGKVQSGYHAMVTRADSGITDLSDLQGKSIATQGVGSTADVVLKGVVLPAGNLQENDVHLLHTAPATALQSLLAGRVDAAFLFEPFDRFLRHQTSTVELYEIGKEWPFPCMVVVVSGEFMRTNPTALRNFLDAIKLSIEFMESNPVEAATLLVPHFLPSGELATSKGAIPGVQIMNEAISTQTFAWYLSDHDLRRMEEIQEIMLEQGLLTSKVEVSEIVDLSWQEKLAN